MAHNGGSNGLRIQPFVGKVVGLKKVGVRENVTSTIPARDGKPAITKTQNQTIAQLVEFDLAAKKPSLELLGTTLTSFFGVIDAKIASAGGDFIVGTLIKRPVINAVEAGQFTYDLEPLEDDQFEIAQELLYAAGLEQR